MDHKIKLDVDGSITANAPSGNASMTLKLSDTVSTALFALTNYGILRRYDATGTNASEMRMYDYKWVVDTDLQVLAMGTADASVTTKEYVSDNFVDLTTAQDIAGVKTFTSDIRVEKASPYLSLRASSGNAHVQFRDSTDTQMVLMYANGTSGAFNVWVRDADGTTLANTLTLTRTAATIGSTLNVGTPTVGTHATTKDYVDDNFVDLTTTQDIAGTKTFNGAVILELPSTNHNVLSMRSQNTKENTLLMLRDGVNESAIYSLTYTTLFRRWATGTNSEFKINDSSFDFNKVVSGVAPTADAHLTTRKYCTDSFVSLTPGATQTLAGDFRIDGGANTYLYLEGTGNGILEFNLSGVEVARVHGNATRLWLDHTHSAAGDDTYIYLNDSNIEMSKDVDIDGQLRITDDLRVTMESASIWINAVSTSAPAETTPRLYFKRDGITKSELWDLTSGLMIRSIGATNTHRIDMFDDYTHFDHDIRADKIYTNGDLNVYEGNLVVDRGATGAANVFIDAGVDARSHLYFRTNGVNTGILFSETSQTILRHYATVDTNIYLFDGSIQTNKLINITHDNAELIVNSTNASGAIIRFKDDNTTTASIQAESTNVVLTRVTGSGPYNRLRIYDNYAEFNKPVRLTNAGSGGTLTLQEGSTNGTNKISISAPDAVTSDYNMVMPSVPPTAGQQLQVGSVVGTTVTMVWV